MKTHTFFKEYDGESIIDITRDINEQWDSGAYADVPDEHGIMEGKFRVSIVWCSEDDCDCVGWYHEQKCQHWVMTF